MIPSLLPNRLGRAVFFLLLIAGCSHDGGLDPKAAEGEAALEGACGSALGKAIARAAKDARHPSTLSPATIDGVKIGIESYANEASRPILCEDKSHDMVDEMVKLVESAEHDVFMQFLTIDESSWEAHRLADACAKLNERHVPVFVMMTPRTHDNAFGQEEGRSDAIARVSRTFKTPNVVVGAWKTTGGLSSFGLGAGVLHSKSIVVDGNKAMVTNANLESPLDPTDERGVTGVRGGGWFQEAVIVRGTIGAALRQEALSAWRNAESSRPLPKDHPTPNVAPEAHCSHMIVLGREASEDSKASAAQGFLALFNHAQRNVNVQACDFNSSVVLSGDSYDGHWVSGLAHATGRVSLHLLLSYKFDDSGNGSAGQGGTNENAANWLVAHAKNRCNVHIRWFVNDRGERVQGNVPTASHAKVVSADGRVVVLGSQNMNVNSWQEAREVSVAIDEVSATKPFDAEFRKLWDRAGRAPHGVAFEPSSRECGANASRLLTEDVIDADPDAPDIDSEETGDDGGDDGDAGAPNASDPWLLSDPPTPPTAD
jgi:phosphatidylserine/phosphatidylglycerophosphate/cardiolipin synthase-like enzyme